MELPESLKYRLACHFLISQVADAGLREVMASLTEMSRFYAELRPQLPAPQPEMSTPAKIVASYVRPVFQIAEE